MLPVLSWHLTLLLMLLMLLMVGRHLMICLVRAGEPEQHRLRGSQRWRLV
jgi:hypothetical protein